MTSRSTEPVALHALQAGQGPETVLLLHGLGSSARDWELQMAPLSAKYRVIAPDLRGHGASAAPRGPWSIAAMAADVRTLLDSLDAPPVHVVGFSMGGMVAFQLALDAPERVKSLTIVNSGPDARPRSAAMWLMLIVRLVALRLLGMHATARLVGRKLFPDADQGALRELFVERCGRNDRRAYEESVRAIVRFDVSARLGELACPTQIVAADQDYTPVSAKRAYASEIQGAELVVIARSRHATPLDQPEALTRALETFVERHDAASRILTVPDVPSGAPG